MDTVMKTKKTIKEFYPESTSSVIKDMDGAVLYSVFYMLFLEDNIHNAGDTYFHDIECDR